MPSAKGSARKQWSAKVLSCSRLLVMVERLVVVAEVSNLTLQELQD